MLYLASCVIFLEACCNKNGPASLIFLTEVHVALSYQSELDQDCLDRVSIKI